LKLLYLYLQAKQQKYILRREETGVSETLTPPGRDSVPVEEGEATLQNGTVGIESRERRSSDNVGPMLSNDLIRDMKRTRRSGDFDDVGLAIGETAVDFTLRAIDRKAVSLGSLLGEKPVVMVFGSFT